MMNILYKENDDDDEKIKQIHRRDIKDNDSTQSRNILLIISYFSSNIQYFFKKNKEKRENQEQA